MARTVSKMIQDPARMDFATLKLFCAAARTHSITRAAADLGLAVSAASRRLADLEAAHGQRLFDRSAQGVRLTDAGMLAFQHAARLVLEFNRLGNDVSAVHDGANDHVSLWATMTALTSFVPGLVLQFGVRHPGIRVTIEEQVSADTVRALIDGIADVGIVSASEPVGNLVTTHCKIDEVVVICHPRHPLAGSRRLPFAACLPYDMVAPSTASSLYALIERAARSEGLPVLAKAHVGSWSVMHALVTAGMGIAVMPLHAYIARRRSREVRVIRLLDTWASRALLAAFNAQRRLTPAAQLLFRTLTASAEVH